MKTQQQTIDLLMEMIKQANLADTRQRMDWQDSRMARSSDLFGHLVAAIRAIGGGDRFDHWVESGDDLRADQLTTRTDTIKNGTEINYDSVEFSQNLQTDETYFLTKEEIASLNVSYDLDGMYRFHIGKSPEVHPSEIRKLVHPAGVYTFRGQIVKWLV